MEIDFIFDAACPWSYIGKRRLDQAIAARPGVTARVNWVPFLLNPELPNGGVARRSFLVDKFVNETSIKRMHETLTATGKSAGIIFNFDIIKITPRTMNAHRLIQMADLAGKGNAAVERIFKSYFTLGSDISSLEVLMDIAEKIGLDVVDIGRRLQSDELVDLVYGENARAHRLGISGAPSFACNGSMIVSGAQEPKILARVIDAATAELKVSGNLTSFG